VDSRALSINFANFFFNFLYRTKAYFLKLIINSVLSKIYLLNVKIILIFLCLKYFDNSQFYIFFSFYFIQSNLSFDPNLE